MLPDYFPLDPRYYVREELDLRQKRRPQYSLRAFARDLEISPSFLCEFLAGRQGLSRARALWISDKINLNPDQREHFWDLIQAKFGHSPKLKHAATLRAMERAKSSASHMRLERFRLIADWYHFVLLEILGLSDGPKSLAEVSDLLHVPRAELEGAIERLKALGLLEVTEGADGQPPKYRLLNEATSVGEDIPDRAVQICHQQTLSMHADAITRKSIEERENVSITFSTRQESWPQLCQELQKAVLDVVAKYADPSPENDQVVSLTAQMMTFLPLAQKSEHAKSGPSAGGQKRHEDRRLAN